ncbi:MAG: cytochrome c biogenesis protein CcsA [Lentisphaeraceae bacterium]|nr:cytochrome c biogenesis protein CcsA [Lentisphaeraceae bacterium]
MQILFGITFLGIITGLFGFVFHAFGKEKKFFVVATIATLIGFISLTALIITQAISNGINQIQPYTILAWFMLLTYFVSENKYRMRILGALIMPIVTIAILTPIFTGTKSDISTSTMKSEFFTSLHVVLILASLTLFFLASAEAVIYILKARALKSHDSSALDESLPALEKLEKIFLGTFNLGWITMTSGLLIALLSVDYSSKNWAFDAKIIWGVTIWVFYTILFFLHMMKKIDPRNLTRSVTVLFVVVITFWIALSTNKIGPASKVPTQTEQGAL